MRDLASIDLRYFLGFQSAVNRIGPEAFALPTSHCALRTSLLGMTFLSRLDGFEINGDKLILRGGPAR